MQTGDRSIGEAWTLCQSNVAKIIEKSNVDIPSLLHGDLFDINIGECNGEPGKYESDIVLQRLSTLVPVDVCNLYVSFG